MDGGAGCSFLSSTCQNDLKTGLTKGWGQQYNAFLCGALPFDSILPSCVDLRLCSTRCRGFMLFLPPFRRSSIVSIAFGSTLVGFDSAFLANSTVAELRVAHRHQLPRPGQCGSICHRRQQDFSSRYCMGLQRQRQLWFSQDTRCLMRMPPVGSILCAAATT